MNQFSERVRFERYRLMVISTWPESEVKRAALASARAALEREVGWAATPPLLVALAAVPVGPAQGGAGTKGVRSAGAGRKRGKQRAGRVGLDEEAQEPRWTSAGYSTCHPMRPQES